MVQSKGINFNGQNIYIGIDVHLKSWSVTIITESGSLVSTKNFLVTSRLKIK